jgi:hypothetical protein
MTGGGGDGTQVSLRNNGKCIMVLFAPMSSSDSMLEWPIFNGCDATILC